MFEEEPPKKIVSYTSCVFCISCVVLSPSYIQRPHSSGSKRFFIASLHSLADDSLVSISFQLYFCCPCTIMHNSTGGGTATPAADYRLPRSQGIAYVSAYLVEFVFIIIGNTVVLAVFGKNQKMRKRKSHWLIIHQALVDLLIGVMTGPVWIYHDLAVRFDLWDNHTDVYRNMAADSICLLLVSASILNLLAIALERMSATLWPIKHRALSARKYRVAIGLVWFLSVLLPCVRTANLFKQISVSTYFFTKICFVSCVLLLIVLSYAGIWIKLKCFNHPQNNLRAAQERKLTASLFLVTAASLMTCLSGTVLFSISCLLSAKKSLSFNSASHVRVSGNLLTSANFMINPMLYAFRMPGFRRVALRLVNRRSHTENRALTTLQTVQRNRANFQPPPATL